MVVGSEVYLTTVSLVLFIIASICGAVRFRECVTHGGNDLGVGIPSWVPLMALIGFVGTLAVFLRVFEYQNLILCVALSVGVIASLFHPAIAASVFLALLILRPWEIASGEHVLTVIPRAFGIIAACSLAFRMALRQNGVFVLSAELVLFAAFVVWLAFASIFSLDPTGSQVFLQEKLLPVCLLMLLLSQSVESRLQLLLLEQVLVASVTALILIDCVALFSLASFSIGKTRLEGFGLLGNSNDLAAASVLALPFAIRAVRCTKSFLGLRILNGLFCMTLLVGVVLTQSRGAFMALVAMAVASVFVGASGRKATLLRIGAVLLACALFLLIQRSPGDLELSSDSRLNYMVAGIRMFLANPMFGVGVGNYPSQYELYTPAFVEWGVRAAHSSWILVLAESGGVGFLLFVSLFLFSIRRAMQVRKHFPEMLYALIGYGICMSFLSHTYIFLPYVLVGFILAAFTVHQQEERLDVVACARMERLAEPITPLRRMLLLVVIPAFCCQHVDAQQLRAQSGLSQRGSIALFPPISTPLPLFGSRGEVLSVQIDLEAHACSRVLFTSGASEILMEVFREELVETQHPSFPGARVGEYFDPLIPLDKHRDGCVGAKGLLLEVTIGEHVPPGTYAAELRVDGDVLPLSIHVWPMRLPEVPSVPIYTELTTWFNLLGHFGKWQDGEEILAESYISLLRKHRIEVITPRISDPPVVEERGQPMLNIDSAPNRAQSFRAIALSGRPDWSYLGFPTVAFEKMLLPETKRYFEAIENTVPALGAWRDRALVYLWDEPSKDRFNDLRLMAQSVKGWAPRLHVLVTTPWDKRLRGLVDIFVPVAEELRQEDFEHYRHLQGSGGEVWWYVSCMSHGCNALADTGAPDLVIDRPSAYIRSIGWISRRFGLDAFLYYHANYGFQFYPKRDPWDSLWDFSGNGDGTLVYPGRIGEHGLREEGAIPSIRLKLLRQTAQDAEYARWMQTLSDPPAWWTTRFSSLVRQPLDWDRDYESYEDLRVRVGNYLERRVQAGGKP